MVLEALLKSKKSQMRSLQIFARIKDLVPKFYESYFCLFFSWANPQCWSQIFGPRRAHYEVSFRFAYIFSCTYRAAAATSDVLVFCPIWTQNWESKKKKKITAFLDNHGCWWSSFLQPKCNRASTLCMYNVFPLVLLSLIKFHFCLIRSKI